VAGANRAPHRLSETQLHLFAHPKADRVLLLGLVAVGIVNLAFFFSRHLTNIYGDSIAHMEGARRLFDSLTPGYSEIGSVWLPLFHVLASPLARNDTLWRTGLAGSVVSSTAFVLTAWIVYRLASELNRSRPAGLVAVTVFLLCPNMMYLASTALTEPLALLWTVLGVYRLFRFRENGRMRTLIGAGFAFLAGTLTRYDAWYLLPFAAAFVMMARREDWPERLRHGFWFSLVAGLGPALWLAHGAARYGNPVEFYNGRYSAQAIYAHQLATTGFRYPTDGSLLLSARYYLEDLKLVIGAWPLELAMLGLVVWILSRRLRGRRGVVVLLLVSLPFYLQSMAHAGVPVYVPTLFPNTYYNLRYGLEMLPAVAVLCSFVVPAEATKSGRFARRWSYAILAVLVLVVGQYALTAARGASELVLVREGLLNTPCQSRTSAELAGYLGQRYDGRIILTGTGGFPCLWLKLNVPFRKTLGEANQSYWLGLKEQVPPSVGWIVRSDGGPVDDLLRSYPTAFRDFLVVASIKNSGEDGVRLYRRRLGRDE
jgi:4-amino-4-deoxy-L-arabinose transferase-like glycosyltransferase